MSTPTYSFWKEIRNEKPVWVCQIRLRKGVDRTLTVQARSPIRATARANAQAAFDRKHAFQNVDLSTTIRGLVEQYLEALQGVLKGTTIGEYAYILERYFVSSMGTVGVSSLTSSDLRKLLQALRDRGLSIATINTIRARIHALLNFGVEEGILQKNVAATVKSYRSVRGESLVQDPWSLSEVNAALSAARGTGLGIYLNLALLTGLRRGEIIALTWGDFDASAGTLRISKSTVSARNWAQGKSVPGTYLQEPKTQSSTRTVFCGPRLLTALMESRQSLMSKTGRIPLSSDPIVHKRDGTPYAPSSLGRIFRKFCQNAGLRYVRIHDLRHTAAVMALEAGVPLEAVSEGLGHKGVEVTKRIYAPRVAGLAERYALTLDRYVSASEDYENLDTKAVKELV